MFKKNTEKTKKEKAFTLIELMLVVAVIGILAGIVTISLSGIKERNLERKVLVELSGVIQPLLTCISDGRLPWLATVQGGAPVCYDIDQVTPLSQYGNWPILNNEEFSYKGLKCGASEYGGLCDTLEEKEAWWFSVDPETNSGNIICCNNKSEKCAIISGSCDNTIDL